MFHCSVYFLSCVESSGNRLTAHKKRWSLPTKTISSIVWSRERRSPGEQMAAPGTEAVQVPASASRCCCPFWGGANLKTDPPPPNECFSFFPLSRSCCGSAFVCFVEAVGLKLFVGVVGDAYICTIKSLSRILSRYNGLKIHKEKENHVLSVSIKKEELFKHN